MDLMYYITDQLQNILYQLAQARPHNVLHFLVYRKHWFGLLRSIDIVLRATYAFMVCHDLCLSLRMMHEGQRAREYTV